MLYFNIILTLNPECFYYLLVLVSVRFTNHMLSNIIVWLEATICGNFSKFLIVSNYCNSDSSLTTYPDVPGFKTSYPDRDVRGYPQYDQTVVEIVCLIGHYRLLPRHFQFVFRHDIQFCRTKVTNTATCSCFISGFVVLFSDGVWSL